MKRLALAWLIPITLLSACDSAAATSTKPVSTSETPRSTLTASVFIATDTPQPGFTLIPSTPIPPTATPAPCTTDAVFLADVTVPDNSQVVPGAPIDKRWKIQNTGTCHWDSRYRLAFFEGAQMNAAGETALFPAKAGAQAVVQVAMTAPDIPGDYAGRWQLRDPNGKPFGPVLFIKITVIPLGTATVAP